MPLRQLTKLVGHDHSVLSRELSRNTGAHLSYHPDRAQKISDNRLHQKRKSKLVKHPLLREWVESQLKAGLSPEQVAGVLREAPPPALGGVTISHESIYQYIYEGEGSDWYRYLRKKHSHRGKKRGRKKHKKSRIPERVPIQCRPKEVDERKEFGHWESDSMIFSKQKAGLSVQYERCSQLVRITRVEDRSSNETRNALLCTIESLPKELFKTMTFDNGGEGVCHTMLRHEYDIDTYFCDPYASWQKGGVENMNGLIREYLPRTKDLATLTDRDIFDIQERLNNRPRKGLGYRTPNAVIKEYITNGALLT